jgi:hypothetical protein
LAARVVVAAGMRLHEFVCDFVRAARAADRRYVRLGDAREIHAGIEVWECLVDAGGLEDLAPEALVEAHLTASMLYTRRFEACGGDGDLERAFGHLRVAQRSLVAGSRADRQARMSRAALLMLAFRSAGRTEDLDEAIALWAGLQDSGDEDAAALAAANLGRALLARHDVSGDADDLHDGRRLLGLASAEMPRDHPALPAVELALRRT